MQADKIALIAPNRDFTSRALDLFSEWGEKIHVAMASKEDVILIARQLSEKGADALICYSDFVKTIKTTVNIPIVSLGPSSLDILRGMQQTKEWLTQNGKHIATGMAVGIIGHSIIDETTIVGDILGIPTRVLADIQGTDMSGILAIVREVPDIISPDGALIEFISDIPCFSVTVGREALLRSVRQAQELVAAGRREWAKLEQIKTIMDFTGEGIVAVDNQRRITYVNHIAEKQLKASKHQIVGKPAATLFPDINLDDALRYAQTRIMPFVDGREQMLACRIVPMIIGGQTVGAVLTINESNFPIKDKAGKCTNESGHKATYCFDDFVTVNETMKETLEIAKSYAGVDSTILIIGETGTGKEIIAQSIHNYSRRCNGPFVAVNCAALPESLLESELFGYEYGAFTGARKNGKKGLFEQADQGTIFLDEIGEISLGMQARLLRVIQEREIMRIGGDKIIPIDVGIIAATHRNLPELIEKGLFRRDLYHRLNILQLHLLPLSARKEDIPYLVECIGKKLSARLFKQPLKFSAGAMNVLACYPWPGNVRELESVIERMLILKNGGVVTSDDIKKVLYCGYDRRDNEALVVPRGTMEEMERAIIRQVLKETGNQDETAKILGISTTTIWRKMKVCQNNKNNFILYGCGKPN
ncbi:Anaerobic nitric oxide reductase transcription regulator NorR [Sporomusa carbonis]|uniref:sigma 54-interacting transcriptional regulator n=1 Tax=Sporomusa carbonis TaxID=3076075 RepID=UPI003A77FC83